MKHFYIFLVLLGFTTYTYGCSCFGVEIYGSFALGTNNFIGDVTFSNESLKNYHLYNVTVQQVYKGCLVADQEIYIATPYNSAACGIELDDDTYYIEAGDQYTIYKSLPVYLAFACSSTKLFDSLTEDETEFLSQRWVCPCVDSPQSDDSCCGCADSNFTACFVEPCLAATSDDCPAALLNCKNNYCGGCNAEFFSEEIFPKGRLMNCTDKCKEELWLGTYCEEDRDCVADIPSGCGCTHNQVINSRHTAEDFITLNNACGDDDDDDVSSCDCRPVNPNKKYRCKNRECSWNILSRSGAVPSRH
eukprot:TRINITY_DN4431_c0_g1_i1.p1 TRINITY_DN4431_c0_g1~~TRINITY_DN4431_c0_g1_i1.p1  ORF type:complete len:304 (+),score=44.11 TRINITY_DN4431_c0_g1_i1:3-914(+)